MSFVFAVVFVQYVPAIQFTQELAPMRAEAYLPAPQFTHVLGVVAPVVVLNLPTSHFIQVSFVFAVVFVEYVPAIQFTQELAPMRAEAYLPAPQFAHVLVVDPKVAINLPASQSIQILLVFAVVFVEYLPGGQILLIHSSKRYPRISIS
jgi:hypothetical protein